MPTNPDNQSGLPRKRPSRASSAGAKMLITTASVAAVVGGWAVFTLQQAPGASDASSTDAGATSDQASIDLPPLPTLIPEPGNLQAEVLPLAAPSAAAPSSLPATNPLAPGALPGAQPTAAPGTLPGALPTVPALPTVGTTNGTQNGDLKDAPPKPPKPPKATKPKSNGNTRSSK